MLPLAVLSLKVDLEWCVKFVVLIQNKVRKYPHKLGMHEQRVTLGISNLYFKSYESGTLLSVRNSTPLSSKTDTLHIQGTERNWLLSTWDSVNPIHLLGT